MKKVTINDVAKHAGVSKKTISRVLNDEPNVSIDTKTKVQRSFEALGYRPNPQARGLATNQSFLIGLLYKNPNKTYVSDLQAGALERCKEDGYNLIIYPEEDENYAQLSNLESVLMSANIDGIMLTPPFSDMKELLELLEQKQLPYIRLGATKFLNHAVCVTSNDTEAAYQMCRYLISLGHSKIGFIQGHPDHNVSRLREEGYVKALKEAGLEVEPKFIRQGYFTFESGEESARYLLSLKDQPTAIFASNDYMAAGVLKVANQKNLIVPHELTVTGFDNAPISSYIWPSLTTVKQPVKAMASEAAKMLIQIVRNKPLETSTVSYTEELIVRESSALAPKT